MQRLLLALSLLLCFGIACVGGECGVQIVKAGTVLFHGSTAAKLKANFDIAAAREMRGQTPYSSETTTALVGLRSASNGFPAGPAWLAPHCVFSECAARAEPTGYIYKFTAARDLRLFACDSAYQFSAYPVVSNFLSPGVVGMDDAVSFCANGRTHKVPNLFELFRKFDGILNRRDFWLRLPEVILCHPDQMLLASSPAPFMTTDSRDNMAAGFDESRRGKAQECFPMAREDNARLTCHAQPGHPDPVPRPADRDIFLSLPDKRFEPLPLASSKSGPSSPTTSGPSPSVTLRMSPSSADLQAGRNQRDRQLDDLVLPQGGNHGGHGFRASSMLPGKLVFTRGFPFIKRRQH